MKTAVITGITGQDGAYLAAFLLRKGYKVFGAYRRTSSTNFWRIEELGIRWHENLILEENDLTDLASCIRLIDKAQPDEIYNLAAQSFVSVSFDQPSTTAKITGLGCLNILEALRIARPSAKFYQASTSEMFGMIQEIPQKETTPFYPRSPYAVAKLFAHWTTVNYRESYGIFASSGILFNHESPLRGLEFVTRKITDGVAKISLGLQSHLELGNLNSERDWGFAGDYVSGMWMMLQAPNPDTYVLATNTRTTVREFSRLAFESAGIDVEFVGEGIDEVAIDKSNSQVVLSVNRDYFRPAEVDLLIGSYDKAAANLGWAPEMTTRELCTMMVESDLRKQTFIREHGLTAFNK